MPAPLPAGKRCSRCKQWKPLDEFHRDRKRRDGRQSYCRICNIERAKAYHAANTEHCRARISKRAGRLRDRNRRLVFEYLLEHACVDCGESDPVVLDHVQDKRANVSKLANIGRPWEEILEEIAKCEVVCANCHRRRTCIRIDSYRVRMLRELRAQRKRLRTEWGRRGSNPRRAD